MSIIAKATKSLENAKKIKGQILDNRHKPISLTSLKTAS